MKRMFAAVFLTFTLAMLAGFSGCATPPTTATAPVFNLAAAQRDVFAAKEAYGVAERMAITYASLTRCKVPAVLPCSDLAVVAQITSARNIARTALAAAQVAVDNPAFGENAISTAVIAGQSGLNAFAAISNQPGSK